jgi:hypothetical protein
MDPDGNGKDFPPPNQVYDANPTNAALSLVNRSSLFQVNRSEEGSSYSSYPSSPSSTFRHGGGSNLSGYPTSEWGSSLADDASSWSANRLSLSQVNRLSNSLGGSSYDHNLPRDIPVMLRVSPDSARSSFGYIYLAIDERIHQETLLAFFNNAGQTVHVLPCPDFNVFLWSNLVGMRDTLFITNLPPYILPAGCHLLENNKSLADVAPNLSWLLDFPSNPTFSGTPCIVPQISRMVPSCPVYPLVTYYAPLTHGTYPPDPDGYNSKFINTHPPIPSAMRGPTSSGNFLPLTTSFDISVHEGSCNTSQYGGLRHTHVHHHTTPRVRGQSVGGCLVISLVTGSLPPTSLDLSSSSKLAVVAKPVDVPVSIKSDITHKPESTIKDKPSDLGIKPIKDKELWLNAKKNIESRLCRPPYWAGHSGALITTDTNMAVSVWWEEVIAYFFEPPVSNLFVGETCFDGKGFERIDHINCHFHPSGAVDALGYIFDLINIKQKANEPVISLKAHFSQSFSSLKMGGISIDTALQVGFML